MGFDIISFINNGIESAVNVVKSVPEAVSVLWKGFKVTPAGVGDKLNIEPQQEESVAKRPLSESHQVKQATGETVLPEALHSIKVKSLTHVKECVTSLPIKQIVQHLVPGSFIISEKEDGSFQFHYKDGSNAIQALPFHVAVEGALILENGKRFPSVAHLMASDEYRFLEAPIILNAEGMYQIDQMKLIYNQAWEISLEDKKVGPEERILIAQLKALVEAETKEQTEAALSKLNLKAYDTKQLLEKTEHLPEPFKGVFHRSIYQSMVKLLGHEWGISTQVLIGGQKISTEGFDRIQAHRKLATSVKAFLVAPVKNGSALSRLDPELRKTMSEAIVDSLERAVDYSKDDEKAQQLLEDYRAKKPVSIGTGWFPHAIEVTLHDGYLFYTNRGLKLNEEVLKPSKAKMKCFKIDDSKVTLDLIKQIMMSKAHESVDVKNVRMQWFEGGLGLHAALGVDVNHPVGVVDKKEQKIGICTWANCKGGFHAELIAILLKHNLENKEKYPTFQNAFQAAERLGTEIFKEWEYENRSRAIDDIIGMEELIKKPGSELTPRTYYELLCELGAKVGRKGSHLTYVNLRPNPVIQDLNREMIAKLHQHMKNLDMKLKDCLVETDFGDHGLMPLRIAMVHGMPGDFLLSKNPQNEVVLHVKTGPGFHEIESIPLKQNPPGYLLGDTPIVSLKDLYRARTDLAVPRINLSVFQ